MLDFAYQKLEQIATWQNFAILFVLFIFCFFVFEWRRRKIGKSVRLFDAHFWYTPEQAQKLLGEIGEGGRQFYAVTQLTLDFLFPFIYGGLFIILLFKLYDSPSHLLLIPIITIVADLLENITTAYLALSFKGKATSVTWIASTFTAAKWIGVYLSGFLILVGVIFFVWKLFQKRQQGQRHS